MKTRIIHIFVVVALIFTQISVAKAVLGPIHVELNMTKPRLSASRANTVTAFKVYIRYNIDIKIHDWYKIWFPIDEYVNSENPVEVIKQICDGLPKIDEKINNPRFVPNEQYFKKFDNPKLKTVGQIYAIKDERGNCDFSSCPDVSKTSDWGSVCGKDQGQYRIIKDPSGLGCWMLGTVLPSLPVDRTGRMEKMKVFLRSTSHGFTECAEEQGYPILINNCSERSWQFNTCLEMDAWRKGYNSIDINTSKNTGIMAPATPGRYSLSIATKPEPEPVESEAFVLPCSDISDVKCQVVSDLLTVNFKTGEGGALDAGSSTITLSMPPDVVLPKKFLAKSIKINGSFVTSAPKVDVFPDHNELVLVVPTDIPNLGAGKIEFLENSGLTFKKTRTKIKIGLSSSSEPNFTDSVEFSAFAPYTSVSPNMELVPSTVKIRTYVAEGKSYPKGATISLTFPESSKLPVQSDSIKVLVNKTPLDKSCKIEGQTMTFNSPIQIDFNLDIDLQGMANPSPGVYRIGVAIDGTSLETGEFEITKSKALVSNLKLSTEQAALACTYEFDYQPSIRNLPDIGDIFSITFPEGTKLPTDPDPSKVTIDGKKVISIGTKDNILKIGSPIKFIFGKWIHFKIDCDIYNTRKHGEYTIAVECGQSDPVNSESFTLEPAPLKSWIYFKDPEKPNCGEWFNKPPILGFDCLNPDAKITFWFNNQPDKSLDYGGEARMMPGSQRAKITWQAAFNGTWEEPQTIQFNLDTIAPPITVLEPKSVTSRTNKKSLTVKGERGFTEMLTDGNNTKYQVTDSVFIRLNGDETQLLEGKIYETKGSGSIKYEFEKTIDLKEGENIVEIIARDQACNETIIKKTVILDTTPPEFEIVSPKEPFSFKEGDGILVKIKTEAGAVVVVNGQYIDPELGQQEDVIYSISYTVVNGANTIKIEVSDAVGNVSSKTISFVSTPRQTVIFLTMDKTSWTVNGIEQTPLKSAPTSRFPNNYKALNGSTYMPISEIAPLLDSWISWVAKEKKVTITQKQVTGADKTIEMWINKPLARIDGKDVKYDSKGVLFPVILNGKTMLPLRFVAENLGAEVTYDPKVKSITIVYPKGG